MPRQLHVKDYLLALMRRAVRQGYVPLNPPGSESHPWDSGQTPGSVALGAMKTVSSRRPPISEQGSRLIELRSLKPYVDFVESQARAFRVNHHLRTRLQRSLGLELTRPFSEDGVPFRFFASLSELAFVRDLTVDQGNPVLSIRRLVPGRTWNKSNRSYWILWMDHVEKIFGKYNSRGHQESE